MPTSFTNRGKSSTTFGELTPIEIGNLTPADNLPGTIPTIPLGEATPNTAIYTRWSNQSKSSDLSWTNRSKSSDPAWTNRAKSDP